MDRQTRLRARTASSKPIAKVDRGARRHGADAAGRTRRVSRLRLRRAAGARRSRTRRATAITSTRDVLSAWFSESAGRLQGVIQTRQAVWEPAHEDAESAGFALLFSVGGQTRYVRAEAPRPPAAVRYDHGTWTEAGGFVSAGPTVGEVVAGSGGTVTIDIPPRRVAGAVLANPFVMTYDGVGATGPHWVDRAPGGAGDQTPSLGTFGADYVVGPCVGGGGGPGGGAAGLSAVDLRAPAKRTGRGQGARARKRRACPRRGGGRAHDRRRQERSRVG